MAIKTITIEIQGKDFDLTIAEARALYNDLSGLFYVPTPSYFGGAVINTIDPGITKFDPKMGTTTDGKGFDISTTLAEVK